MYVLQPLFCTALLNCIPWIRVCISNTDPDPVVNFNTDPCVSGSTTLFIKMCYDIIVAGTCEAGGDETQQCKIERASSKCICILTRQNKIDLFLCVFFRGCGVHRKL